LPRAKSGRQGRAHCGQRTMFGEFGGRWKSSSVDCTLVNYAWIKRRPRRRSRDLLEAVVRRRTGFDEVCRTRSINFPCHSPRKYPKPPITAMPRARGPALGGRRIGLAGGGGGAPDRMENDRWKSSSRAASLRRAGRSPNRWSELSCSIARRETHPARRSAVWVRSCSAGAANFDGYAVRDRVSAGQDMIGR